MTACSAVAIDSSWPCSAFEMADKRRSRDLEFMLGARDGRRNGCDIELVRRFISHCDLINAKLLMVGRP